MVQLRMEDTKDGPNKIHISLGPSGHLPASVLLSYDKNPPLLQAWVDLFYRCMEELWAVEEESEVGKDVNLLTPAKLVASNQTDNLPEKAKLISSDLKEPRVIGGYYH